MSKSILERKHGNSYLLVFACWKYAHANKLCLPNCPYKVGRLPLINGGIIVIITPIIYKWPYKLVAGVITPISGVKTLYL